MYRKSSKKGIGFTNGDGDFVDSSQTPKTNSNTWVGVTPYQKISKLGILYGQFFT